MGHLKRVKERPVVRPEEIRLQWKAVLREYVRYMRMRFGRDHREEEIRVLTGRMGRRLMELREEMETKLVHRIQKKLGARFLATVPTEPLQPWKNAPLRSMRREEMYQSQPPPSISPSPPFETESSEAPS
jgi:hypothetical protein